MIAVLKSSQGRLWEIRHTKPRLSWREIHWKVWSSPVGEDLPRCVHLCLCLSLFLFLSSGGGGGVSHPLLYEPSISSLLFCIPIHMLFSTPIHMLFSTQGRMWLLQDSWKILSVLMRQKSDNIDLDARWQEQVGSAQWMTSCQLLLQLALTKERHVPSTVGPILKVPKARVVHTSRCSQQYNEQSCI